MPTYRLRASQVVPRPLDEVFAFFATPENLSRITPAGMGFEFRSDDFRMRAGLAIDYRIRPLLGIPLSWRTRITEFEPPNRFVDIQERGPYGSWTHTHTFEPVDGGTRVDDEIRYTLPLGPLGSVAHALVVRSELEQIFRFRARTIERVFAPAGQSETPMTVAVVGGTGFVGRGIAHELRGRGHRPVVVSHSGEPARGDLPDDVEIRVADAASGEGLDQALAGADAVIIALAFRNLPMEQPRRGQTFMRVDAGGAEHVVAAARRTGVGRLLYVSGAGPAPDADKVWFRAKWRAEEAVRGSGLTWTIIRPTWVYGPNDVALNRFLWFARHLPFVPMPNRGRQRLAPVFIDDLGRLAVDCLTDPAAADQLFELGGPESLEMREIIRRATRIARVRRPIIPGPTPLIRLAAWPLKWLPTPPLTPDAVDFIIQPATVDTGPLLERMPRRLTPLDEGLRTYLAPDSGPGTLTFDTVDQASP